MSYGLYISDGVNGGVLTNANNVFNEEYDFEFARDCINAIEISATLDHNTLTFYFLQCALKRGIPISYFDGKPELKNFRLTQYYSSILDSSSIFKKEFDSNINAKIRGEINEMFEDDQQIREHYYKWWNFPLRPVIREKWKKLNQKQVIKTVNKHGNCSSASIPIALSDLVSNNNIKPGTTILMSAFGAGLTWGSSLIKW